MDERPAGDLSSQAVLGIEREVDELRDRTQALIGELERRVHDRIDRARATVAKIKHAVDLPAHLRAHPRVTAGLSVGTVVAIGFSVWFLAHRRGEASRPMARLRHHVHAWGQLLADPDRVPRKRRPQSGGLVGALLVGAGIVLGYSTLRAWISD